MDDSIGADFRFTVKDLRYNLRSNAAEGLGGAITKNVVEKEDDGMSDSGDKLHLLDAYTESEWTLATKGVVARTASPGDSRVNASPVTQMRDDFSSAEGDYGDRSDKSVSLIIQGLAPSPPLSLFSDAFDGNAATSFSPFKGGMLEQVDENCARDTAVGADRDASGTGGALVKAVAEKQEDPPAVREIVVDTGVIEGSPGALSTRARRRHSRRRRQMLRAGHMEQTTRSTKPTIPAPPLATTLSVSAPSRRHLRGRQTGRHVKRSDGVASSKLLLISQVDVDGDLSAGNSRDEDDQQRPVGPGGPSDAVREQVLDNLRVNAGLYAIQADDSMLDVVYATEQPPKQQCSAMHAVKQAINTTYCITSNSRKEQDSKETKHIAVKTNSELKVSSLSMASGSGTVWVGGTGDDKSVAPLQLSDHTLSVQPPSVNMTGSLDVEAAWMGTSTFTSNLSPMSSTLQRISQSQQK